MRVVGGGWCVTVFYFVLFFFLPCAYNFPNWEKKKKRKVLFRVACPQTVRPRVTAACGCSATHPAPRLDPQPPTCGALVQTGVHRAPTYLCSADIQSPHMSVAQSCLTLCDPMDCSLPGFSVRESFQARALEWIAIFVLRGISPAQGSNSTVLGLLRHRRILDLLSHQGSPLKYNFGFIHSSATTTLQVLCTKCFSL